MPGGGLGVGLWMPTPSCAALGQLPDVSVSGTRAVSWHLPPGVFPGFKESWMKTGVPQHTVPAIEEALKTVHDIRVQRGGAGDALTPVSFLGNSDSSLPAVRLLQ